jgi:hypothetical protein
MDVIVELTISQVGGNVFSGVGGRLLLIGPVANVISSAIVFIRFSEIIITWLCYDTRFI